MRSSKLFLLAVVILPAGLALAAETPPAGHWQSLFNGKDLKGWVPVHGASFVVTDSNLRLLGGTGWLRTERLYTNFVFEAEWRALTPGYDSGFFIRARREGEIWPTNAWQVNLARNAVGGLVKGNTPVVPSETAPVPLNQWVKFRMEAKGPRLTLDVDGERVWEFKELDATSGYLGIEAEDKAFDFRNLRVLELP